MTTVKEAPKTKAEDGHGRMAAGAQIQAPVKGERAPMPVLRRFAREMDQLFEQFGLETGMWMPKFLTRGREMLRREVGFVPAEWSPRVDVVEKQGKVYVRADLPGVARDDVKVEITDQFLTIQGERKHEETQEHEGYSYHECSHGAFYRAIPLPEGAETARATAEFHDGVLEVTVPVPETHLPRARRLEIQGEKK